MSGYVYLVQPEEHVSTESKVFKVGRTINIINRMKAYGGKSQIICSQSVDDMVSAEKSIIEAMEMKFKKVRGKEYFEGDRVAVISLFRNVLNELLKTKEFYYKLKNPKNGSDLISDVSDTEYEPETDEESFEKELEPLEEPEQPIHPDFGEYNRDISFDGDSIIAWIRVFEKGGYSIRILHRETEENPVIIEEIFDKHLSEETEIVKRFLKKNPAYFVSPQGFKYILNREQYKKIARGMPNIGTRFVKGESVKDKDHIETLWPKDKPPSLNKIIMLNLLITSPHVIDNKALGCIHKKGRNTVIVWNSLDIAKNEIVQNVVKVHPKPIRGFIWSLNAIKCCLPVAIVSKSADFEKYTVLCGDYYKGFYKQSSEDCYIKTLDWETIEETGVIINLKSIQKQFDRCTRGKKASVIKSNTKTLLKGIKTLKE